MVVVVELFVVCVQFERADYVCDTCVWRTKYRDDGEPVICRTLCAASNYTGCAGLVIFVTSAFSVDLNFAMILQLHLDPLL